MAKQRPTLGTFASPNSQLVTPIQQQATPLNEQAIRDTYAFAEAFSDLSASVGSLAIQIQKERKQENLEAGVSAVLSSRKTYAELEREGKIRPAENPWMAVGAQQASGILEAATSSNEIRSLVSKAAAENPEFLDDSKHFDALVSSYAQRKAQQYGGNKYLSDAFFESFNPSIIKLQQENFEAIEDNRLQKSILAADAKVKMAVESVSPMSLEGQVGAIQASFDEAVANSGGRASEITQAYAMSLVQIMKSDPEKVEEAEMILKSLKTGTGNLYDTSAVQSLLIKYGPEIENQRSRATTNETRILFDKQIELLNKYSSGVFGEGPEAHKKLIDEFDKFAARSSGNISIDAAKTESEREYLYRKVQAIDNAKASAREDALKKAAEMDKQAQEERANSLVQIQAQKQLELGDKISTGQVTVAEANDIMTALLRNKQYGYSEEDVLKYTKASTEFFNSRSVEYTKNLGILRTNTARQAVAQEAMGQITQFIQATINDPMQGQRPFSIPAFQSNMDRRFRAAGLTQEQRNVAKDQLYFEMSEATERSLDSFLMKSGTSGGIAPVELDTLEPRPNDTPELRKYKENARAVKLDALLSLDEAFEQEDTIASMKNIAATMLTPEAIERGVPHQVRDLWRAWKSSKSGYFRENLFSTPGGKRLEILFNRIDVRIGNGADFDNALADAASDYSVTQGSSILDWTNITQAAQGDQDRFNNQVKSLISGLKITHPDSRRLLEGLYGSEVIRIFQSSAENPLNLSTAIRDASTSVRDSIVTFDGSFMFKEAGIGEGSYTAEHFRNLAGFYAPGVEKPVFYPVSKLANGTHIYALRDQNGNIVQNRVFTVEQLVGPEAEQRSTFFGKTKGTEQKFLESRGEKWIDYSATFEAANARMRSLITPPSENQ
jgi:hypothetical protein